MTTYNDLNNAGAKTAPADQENFIKNFFASVLNYVKVQTPFPVVNNIVTDFYIDLYKLQYDYNSFNATAKTGRVTSTDVKSYIKAVALFRLTDVRGFKTSMNSDKAIGSVQFDVNNNLIADSFVSGRVTPYGNELDTKYFSVWDGPDVSIDMMDIIKIYQRNRFDANYTCIFTGFITSNQDRNMPKVDQIYSYTGGDVSTALRLATVVTNPSMSQLINKGYLDPRIAKNVMWDNSELAGRSGLELIQNLIGGSWYIYPSPAQLGTATASGIPSGSELTAIEVNKPIGLGLLNVITFPKDFEDLQAYGRSWNSNLGSLYSSREKFVFDICKDIAETTGFEFYSLPNGDFYYGIPKWDIDVDGSSYFISPTNPNSVQRLGYFSIDGTLKDKADPQWLKNEQDQYLIGADDFVSFERGKTIDNIFTRVDVQPSDFSQDVLSQRQVLTSIFKGEALSFSYPDFNFKDGRPQLDPNSEEFKDLVRYGMRPFPVSSKIFLKTPADTLYYAKHMYSKLKAMRTTGSLTILPRPEIMQGRTIRIPHINVIAYIKTVSHVLTARKSAATVLGLVYVRSAVTATSDNDQFSIFDSANEIEKKYGYFTPCSSLNYALMGT